MTDKIKTKIEILVNRFRDNLKVYKNPKYNETQLRLEFLDPFFKALGWDVANELGYAEQFKDVVHEDAIKIGDTTKAPDYSFRIGGIRKFFVEAKKPSVDIKSDIHPSFQLRRYAWSAKLPISILTDFEEFSVYDCRIKPHKNDNASVARIYYQTFDNYLKEIDFIVNTFSKEAILKGSFDKYINSATKKRGTSEVDKVFLKEIENWRETLAKNIALRNKFLSIYELNFVVQRTIDRIIFLRIAEDRGVEEYRNLFNLTKNENIYKQLYLTFEKADDKYNSGIFDFKKDTISADINIDDKVLKPILKRLYYPESPYEFSVLPADILGNIYEQFLGKTIRLTPSHQAKVEEKPEVRKAGGVYYTPKYIVDYIVKNTVGEKIKNKTPQQISKITICDPACGSGSFLIQAYQFLLDYHLQFYQKDFKKYKNQIFQIGENNFQLTTKEKKRILLNNIYGVDIDQQAIEVTKLSLLLKVLEGENKETLNQQLKFFQERALPSLDKNIKCGNSLIGTDYYEDKNFAFFEDDEIRKVNAFDWEKEFAKIFANGGFDCVIGNPPYIFARGKNFSDSIKKYYKSYELATYQLNTYLLFINRAYQKLKRRGYFGFIVPNTWLTIHTFATLRKFLLEKVGNLHTINIFDKVFGDANVDTCLLTFRKSSRNKITLGEFKDGKLNIVGKFQPNMFEDNKHIINIELAKDKDKMMILKKVNEKSKQLNEVSTIKSGFVAYETGKGAPKQTNEMKNNRIYHSGKNEGEYWYKYLDGKDVKRYQIDWSGKWVKYGKWLAAPRTPELYTNPRILVRQIPSQPPYSINGIFTDENMLMNDRNSMIILHFKTNPIYLLAVLNSRLTTFWFVNTFDKFQRKTFPQFKVRELAIFPVFKIDFSNPKEKAMHDQLVSLVEQMLLVQKQFHSANIERDKKLYQQKIDILDRKIDNLVYELYGLSEAEIEIIEKNI